MIENDHQKMSRPIRSPDQPAENGKVSKGTDQIIDFTAQEPGTYDFVCAKFCGFGHDRMKGKTIVEP